MSCGNRIELRYAPQPVRETHAQFLAGSDPCVWLSALSVWKTPLSKLSLYIVPESTQDLRPRGVLITTADGSPFDEKACGHPYGLVAGRMFVPVDGVLEPELTDAEWKEALEDVRVYVWHPRVGLVGFDPADRLRVSDLLQLPQGLDEDWNHAQPGTAFNRRLFSVDAVLPLSPHFILEVGREDIGARSDELNPQPSAAIEAAKTALGVAAAAALIPFAWIGRSLAAVAPKTASQPTWIDHFGNWAERVLKGVGDLFDFRLRAIQDLLRKLETDPDEGLKFALPMEDGGAARGLAPPGFRLLKRLVDFDLGNLVGGRASDPWFIPPNLQVELGARYRALAEREVRLGRHRRAAYIYAHLLNDLNSAAATLAAGGHYREAAILYKERLGRPAEAAKCYERGGLLHEAITLYREQQRFEEVGDLYARLEQLDDAAEAYREAAAERVRQNDYLKAARLFDEKLSDPDEALVALSSGWPSSSQARACLDESFRILGRLGRHQDAAELVAAVRRQTLAPAAQRNLVESLATQVTRYPHGTVRSAAADAARVVVSRALMHSHGETGPLLRAIESLVPEDRLLLRDCRRYREPKNVRKPVPSVYVDDRVAKCKAARTVSLPPDFEWRGAAAIAAGFYIVGTRDDQILLLRGAWSDQPRELDHISWRSPIRFDTPALMSIVPEAQSGIRLMFPGHAALPRRAFPASAAFMRPLSAETPAWLDDDALAIDASHGTTWVWTRSAVLHGYDREGLPIGARSPTVVAVRLLQDSLIRGLEPADVSLYAQGSVVYLGVKELLFSMSSEDPVVTFKLDSKIRTIVGSGSSSRVAVFCERGGTVKMRSPRNGDWEALPDSLEEPRGVFLRDGRLVICTLGHWYIHSKSDGGLQELHAYPHPKSEGPPLAVLRTHAPNEFAVLWPKGDLVVYQVPP